MATRYLLLLRGINVGGNNIIPMADLKALLAKLGYTGVSTYIASGNVLFTSAEDADVILKDLAPAITKKFKCAPALVLRTAEELASAIKACPFAEADPARVLIGFPTAPTPAAKPNAKAKPDPARLAWREPADAVLVKAGHIHLHCPGGLGTTKLDTAYLDKLYGVTATYRNLRTCRTLLEKLHVP